MKVAVVLALAAFAQVAVAFSDDTLTLDAWQSDATATVRAQRSLLQNSPGSGYYSPRYSPTPSPSPPAVPSPRPTPSPKVCKFAKTKNVNYYSVTIRSTKNWGAGRDAIRQATRAVYLRYSQRRLRAKITGAFGQTPQVPYYDFTYLVEVPVTPCVGFKEGMRAALRTAIKRVKAKGQIKIWFGIIA